ncbi:MULTISPECIES: YjcZ family sporulation protein [Ureibacillus]|nr:YjcZ family sporulation protein [Ureibacillus thermosphaericus]
MSSNYGSVGGFFGNKCDFVLLVVLFILLIIVGSCYNHGY